MAALQKLAKKPAVLWGGAALLAVVAGVAWAYYWRVFYYLDARVSPLLVTGGCVLACLAAVAMAGVLHYGLRSFAAKAAIRRLRTASLSPASLSPVATTLGSVTRFCRTKAATRSASAFPSR